MLRRLPKLAALALALIVSLGEGWTRFLGIEGWGGRIAYIGLFAIAWAGLLAAAWTRPAWLRWIYALLFASATIYVETYIQASRSYLTYDTHINLVGSAGALSDAVIQNERAILMAVALGLTLLLGIGLGPVRRFASRGRVIGSVLPVVTILLTAIMFLRGGDGGKGLPAGYTGLAYTALERFETFRGGLGTREAVTMPRASKPLYRKIVLIIDESISGNYLDTGGLPGAVATPLTRSQAGLEITNYGIVPAITNCSIGTNLALRFAVNRDDYLAQIAKKPSLFAFAKAAGMQTAYLDAQRTEGLLHDGMTQDEADFVDRFVQFPEDEVMTRDMTVAEELVRILADPHPTFVIVNKIGAHFPVQDKFPDSFAIDRPIPARGNFVGISDTGSRKGFDGSPDSWRRYRNAYRNTLRWNVGEFFRRFFARAKLDDALVIYTSDHGQDLHEDGRAGTTTHCQADPKMGEGAVPLVTIVPEGSAMRFASQNPASHYRIGPTLLAAMGFERAAVRRQHGFALDEGGNDPGTFNTLFNARLGREPVWRKLDHAQLPLPPAGDIGR